MQIHSISRLIIHIYAWKCCICGLDDRITHSRYGQLIRNDTGTVSHDTVLLMSTIGRKCRATVIYF